MGVDLSKSIHESLQRALQLARDYTEKGDHLKAAQTYGECAQLARSYAAYALNMGERKRRMEMARVYARLKEKFLHPELYSASAVERPDAVSEQGVKQAEKDNLKEDILDLIFKSSVGWDDIGGLNQTKQEIMLAFGIALARKPQGVRIGSTRNILLYGPPGTGKTLLAAATSGALDATFFNVKVSSMMSKYFGETTKLISTLYETAREYAPSVVFMDEFESLCINRSMSESGAERRMLSNLLTELDGLTEKGSEDYVLTIGSTNTPWLLDEAALSRFQKRIYVPLPDQAARLAILKIHIIKNGHKLEGSLESLAQRIEGLSGREIGRICTEVISGMIHEQNPELERTVEKGKEAVKKYNLKIRSLREEEFYPVLKKMKPDATREALQKYENWGRE